MCWDNKEDRKKEKKEKKPKIDKTVFAFSVCQVSSFYLTQPEVMSAQDDFVEPPFSSGEAHGDDNEGHRCMSDHDDAKLMFSEADMREATASAKASAAMQSAEVEKAMAALSLNNKPSLSRVRASASAQAPKQPQTYNMSSGTMKVGNYELPVYIIQDPKDQKPPGVQNFDFRYDPKNNAILIRVYSNKPLTSARASKYTSMAPKLWRQAPKEKKEDILEQVRAAEVRNHATPKKMKALSQMVAQAEFASPDKVQALSKMVAAQAEFASPSKMEQLRKMQQLSDMLDAHERAKASAPMRASAPLQASAPAPAPRASKMDQVPRPNMYLDSHASAAYVV